jgi:predicted Zn-dependent protease with MMP-like domain
MSNTEKYKKSEHWKKLMSLKYTGSGNPRFGKRASSETRQKMSKSQKISCRKSPSNFSNLSPERLALIVAKAQEINKTKTISSETKLKISKATSGVNNPFYGKHHTEETKRKLSNIRKAQIALGCRYGFAKMSKEQLREINQRTIAKCCARPNKAESRLMNIIDEACPGQYRYTGDASVRIANLYPDFLNVNGKKKVIEMFGNYFHSDALIKERDKKTARKPERIAIYQAYGFDCLIIWESELKSKSKEELIYLVREFNEGGKV